MQDLNTAHIEIEDAAVIVKNLRAVSDRIGILIDTKGPEVRIRDLNEPLSVTAGETIHVSADDQPEHGFCVNYDAFVNEVPVGSDLLIDDGEIHLTVDKKEKNHLVCKVTNSGEIKNRKSVNVPGVNMKMPSLTNKDANLLNGLLRMKLNLLHILLFVTAMM